MSDITIHDVYKVLNEKYPYRVQEDYDNSGIMADCGCVIRKIVISLDITNSVVEYAREVGAQLILSHHPIIFRPIRNIAYNAPVRSLLMAGISALSAHTNFDICTGGVNDCLAESLGLVNVKPVFKVSKKPVNGVMQTNYIGRAGTLPREMTPAELARYTAECLCHRTAMEYVDGEHPISRIAVAGGSCGEFVFECRENGIDAFITGEAKHHELVFAKDNGITMIVAGHYATENVALEALAETVKQAFSEVEVIITRIDDPISFTE